MKEDEGGEGKEKHAFKNLSNSEFRSSLSYVSFRYLIVGSSRQPGRICWPLPDFYHRAIYGIESENEQGKRVISMDVSSLPLGHVAAQNVGIIKISHRRDYRKG